MKIVEDTIKVTGMTCQSCEKIINKALLNLNGVKSSKANFVKSIVKVSYNKKETNLDEIKEIIEKNGYEISKPMNFSKLALDLTILIAVLIVLYQIYFLATSVFGFSFPSFDQDLGYGLLLVIGFMTSFHCVAMCGGFVLSYSAKEKKQSFLPHLLYVFGKMFSYTLIGAIFGLIGSIFVFTIEIRSAVALISGLFLIVYGIGMLNVIPIFRKVKIKIPYIDVFIAKNMKKGPLIVGLLNGLMIACGPLQAMYIYAAGTGDPVKGALSLFFFGIGTLPFLIGFGVMATRIASSMSQKIVRFSGVLIILLGLMMFVTGLTLVGINPMSYGIDVEQIELNEDSVAKTSVDQDYQEIRMSVESYGWEPSKFVLKKGVLVRWIIEGKSINGCNNEIIVPSLGLKIPIKQGEQVIEFTPDKEGIVNWSCWMGMIPGVFVVKEDLDLANTLEVAKELDAIQVPEASSCGAGGGGCGCGGGRL